MKKTIHINLAGHPFVIDEDAYLSLSKYLDVLKMHFIKTEGSDEILEDIEDGIAHILNSNMGKRKIVTLQDIQSATQKMGAPEDIDQNTEEAFVSNTTSRKEVPPFEHRHRGSSSCNSRKLYRDEENKIIAGVCAGIANYFDVHPWLVRVIFIAGLLPGVGSPLVFYILLWFLIPPANTPVERMRMRGGDINIENIVKKAEREIRDLADRLTEWTEKKINQD